MANSALRPGALQKPSKAARRRLKTIVARAERGQLQKLYAYVYHRDQYRCVACRHKVEPGSPDELKRAHPHHIVPRSLADKATRHTKENIATVCGICHANVTEHRLEISGNAERHLTITRIR